MRSNRIYMWPLMALMFLLSACASHKEAIAPIEVVWPLPPDKPRVRYVKTIRVSTDVEPARRLSMLDTLVGNQTGGTTLSKPYGLHVDKDGRLFVADTGWHKVLVFDAAKKSFWFLGVDGLGVLAQPTAVSSDAGGNLYVSDASQARVVVYHPDGTYLNAFGGRQFLMKPVGIAVDDARDRVYVVDTKQHKVVVFDKAGNFITKIGQHGPGDGEFNWPTNVALGPNGNLHVVDMLNFRVQVFNPDGELLHKFGGVGRGFGQFAKPKGVGVSASGLIFVSDAAFNNVQIFDPQGRLLLFFGGMGVGPGQFWMPAGVALAADGTIYVADQFNKRINVYELITYEDDEVAAAEAK